MPFSDCKTGEWYVVITCHSCGARQPLYADPSEGKSNLDSTIVQCAFCERKSFYKASDFERYRHSSGDLNQQKQKGSATLHH